LHAISAFFLDTSAPLPTDPGHSKRLKAGEGKGSVTEVARGSDSEVEEGTIVVEGSRLQQRRFTSTGKVRDRVNLASLTDCRGEADEERRNSNENLTC